jgi:hypothetical protein
MAIDRTAALENVLDNGDEWQAWRGLNLEGEAPAELPDPNGQHVEGGFIGPSGDPSPGSTGEALCQLVLIGLADSGAVAVASDWLLSARTPAEAWLDSPADVPGHLDSPGGARVWATASACCGLLATDNDPGHRAFDLLRGEADLEGRFTGGAYPTFAAAGAYWLHAGPKSEMAEWALRWAREYEDETWEPWELATALTFWGAAGVPSEHASVDRFLDRLQDEAPASGWRDDIGLTIRALELISHFGA